MKFLAGMRSWNEWMYESVSKLHINPCNMEYKWRKACNISRKRNHWLHSMCTSFWPKPMRPCVLSALVLHTRQVFFCTKMRLSRGVCALGLYFFSMYIFEEPENFLLLRTIFFSRIHQYFNNVLFFFEFPHAFVFLVFVETNRTHQSSPWCIQLLVMFRCCLTVGAFVLVVGVGVLWFFFPEGGRYIMWPVI